ncbi:ATP-binding protein [Mesorhizobium sp. M0663]|uniref:ATP-binding protein n=1 Tax=unclassified Mesorhizobium TaxID=325217 RepID=UPI00333B9DE5
MGDQLIGTPRLAVFELVKNAYDADATKVTVTISGLYSEPFITVEDDGSGMSLETIQNIWLVPAHDHRKQQRAAVQRTKLGRLPLGEKGLGRFAVHKLGDKITLVTRALGQPECVVEIDWAQLIEVEFLEDAAVTVIARDPEVFTGNKTGTKIVISQLRDESWSRGNVRRLFRQITSISSPFANRSSDFEATLLVPEHPEWIADVPDMDAILKRAPWHFSFTFDGTQFAWKYSFRGIPGIQREPRTVGEESGHLLVAPDRAYEREASPDLDKPRVAKKQLADKTLIAGLGPVSGEFYVFDRDRLVLSRLGDSELIQTFLDDSGGVRVYRDGMRIYNYGEPGDDWLGLDLQRVNNPTRDISRNIVVGAIELSLENSPDLVEKTNREGFVENLAYSHLRQIVLGAMSILATERKIDKDHIRLILGAGSDPETRRITKPLQDLRNIAKKHRLSDQMVPLIDKIEGDYNEMRETLLKAGLSGMGLAVVFHEIEQGVRFLYKAIEAGTETTTVQGQARELVRLLDGFAVLLRKGDRKDNSLKQLIKRARDMTAVRFRAHNVRLVCPALEDDAPEVFANFSFGLALGALSNLIDNAIYWLDVRWPEDDAKPSPRIIYMDIYDGFDGGPAVVMSDTGPGFKDNPDDLIRPFFTRRPEGMGVGLYYTNMVMELNGGRLLFPDPVEANVPENFDGATLAMVFPPARTE